jgi:endonuclease/exonuclease/phosphatase family metal-dependent hydrolase
MHLWQANLGRGVPVAEFERNLCRVLDAAGDRAVICLQEIDEADKPDEMAAVVELARDTHRIVGRRTAVPILVPRHLELLDAEQTPACKGLALFTPNRIVNEARVELGIGLEVGVLNTHLPLDRLVTRRRRRQVRHTLRERAVTNPGGAWVADTNTRTGWPRIVPGERQVIEQGIDRAKAWAPDGWRLEVTQHRTVPLTIDNHDAHGARILWVPR